MSVATRASPRNDGGAASFGAALRSPAHLALAAAVLVGGVLRGVGLGAQSLWYDEAQTAHEVSLSFGGLLDSLKTHETNPPLYFVLEWAWAHLFGTSEIALRSLSALAGVALIPLAYACGRELVSRRAGLVAAGLAAVNPFLIWYAQEAREYSLLAALSAASLLAFARFRAAPGRRALVAWTVCSALALLTHFFAAFLVWPGAVWLLARHRTRAMAAATAVLLAVQAALLPFALTHATRSLLSFVATTPLSIRLEHVPVAFGLGSLEQSTITSYGWLVAAGLAALVILLLVSAASARQLEGAGVAAALAACVIVLPLLAAVVGKDYFIARALIPAWVPLAVVIGAACTADHARGAGWALATVLGAIFVFGQVRVTSDPHLQRADWRGVAGALGPSSTARAIVLADGGLATDPMRYYLPRVPWSAAGSGAAVSELDVVASPYAAVLRPLPSGTRLIANRLLSGFRVVRVAVSPPLVGGPSVEVARAGALVAPLASAPAVLVQLPR